MTTYIEEFKNKYPAIKIEEEIYLELLDDGHGDEIEVEITEYNLTAIPNLDGLTLSLSNEIDFRRLDLILESNPTLFKDFLGGVVGGNVEIVLSRVDKRSALFFHRLHSSPIQISIGYQSRILEVEVHLGPAQKSDINFLADKMVGISRNFKGGIARISGLQTSISSQMEADVKQILTSVLFDIECSYGIGLQTANLESLKPTPSGFRKSEPKLPSERINLLYKPYIPELIEYFHTGERVDHVPFKFICYFHVVEYFMDRSAYSVVAKKIKQIIASPDFHAKSAEYINDAVKIFRAENEKFMSDKVKIARVLSEYVGKEDIRRYLDQISLTNHFEDDHVVKCGKDLKVNAIKFDSDHTFNETLTKRIYAIRCSIVHSNPDFDETKAVPFSSTPANIDFLRKEIELMKEVARIVISNSIT